MKQLFFITVGLFFIVACGTEKFASVSEDDSTTLVASEEQSKPEEKIQELIIPEVKEKKIANKKRQDINIVNTVGTNQLKKTKPSTKSSVTHIDVTNRVVVTTEVKETVADVKSPDNQKTDSTESTEIDLGPELNILFYTDKRDWGTCMDHLRKNHNSFLDGISDYGWEIEFAYYADAGQAKLMPLELVNGRAYNKKGLFEGGLFSTPDIDYTLSKGEYAQDEAERLFSTTLKPVTPNHEEHSSANLTPNRGKKMANPLSGLDELLSSGEKNETPTVVLFFGSDFPYNSTEEWNNFYSKHSNVAVVVISRRSSNVSNFLHVLEKGHNFSFVANCNIQKTLEVIANQVN